MLTRLITILSLSCLTLAAPLLTTRDPAVTITLIDATQHEFTVTIPGTQTWTLTNVAESISHVQIENTGYVPCTFYGVDGAMIVSMPGDVKGMDVGAPQTIVGGICGPCKWE